MAMDTNDLTAGGVRLGRAGRTTCRLAETAEPWTLEVDALVVSAGGVLGDLGESVMQALPDPAWSDVEFEGISPGRPQVLRLHERRQTSLRTVIVATPHAAGPNSVATGEAAAEASANAVLAAAGASCRSLGMPLLGTGRLDIPVPVVARMVIPAVREALASLARTDLVDVVFVSQDAATTEAIRQAWNADPSQPVPPDVEKKAAPQRDYPSRLSGHARMAVRYARVLAERAGKPGEADASFLFVGALMRCREVDTPGATRTFFESLVATASTDRDPDALMTQLALALEVPSLENLQVGSDPDAGDLRLSPVLKLAEDLADSAGPDQQLHLRHVLGASLLAGRQALDPRLLETLGMRWSQIRDVLLAAVREGASQDDQSVWKEHFERVSAASTNFDLAGGISPDSVDPTKGIPLSEDRLGVSTYVSMMASVIADVDTPMPLSIGIFGEWGSGKSYFMGLLRHRIRELEATPGSSYCTHISQISFNAWHYADSNLWASLGDEIFRQLVGPSEAETKAERQREDVRRAELKTQLHDQLEQRQRLTAATEEATRETARLQERLASATAESNDRSGELARALTKSDTLGKLSKKAWRRLGLSSDAQKGELLATEIRGSVSEAQALRQYAAGARLVPAVGLVILVLVLAAVLAGWYVGGADGVAWLKAAASGLAVAISAALVIAARVHSGLRALRQVAAEVASGREAVRTERLQPLVDDLRAAEATEDVTRAQLDEVIAHVGQLGQQLAELAPGQRLYGFLAERAASGDYAGNLGLISTIRKDFEKLIKLLKESREAEGSEANRRDRRDRPDHQETDGPDRPLHRRPRPVRPGAGRAGAPGSAPASRPGAVRRGRRRRSPMARPIPPARVRGPPER